jgi:hypothetical protein
MRSFERTLLGLLALVGSTLAVACTAEPSPDPFISEQPSTRSNKKSPSNDDDSNGDETPAPATTTASTGAPSAPPPAAPVVVVPADTVYTGTLAKTTNAKFGGTPFCDYQFHFENVNVKVVVGPDGNIKTATVTGRAIEQGLNGCPNATIAANLHDYTLGAAVNGASFTIDGGGPAAEPRAKLDAKVSASGSSGSVTLKIVRNDGQTAPLVWTINATVPLTKI